MTDQKQTNTQEMLGSLREMNGRMSEVCELIPSAEFDLQRKLVHESNRIDRQLAHMNSQLRSIRHCCNFVVVALVFYFLAFVWQIVEFYASIPIEQY